jgi:hypothetical protein
MDTSSPVTAIDIICARFTFEVRADGGKLKLRRDTYESADRTVSRMRELAAEKPNLAHLADAYTHVGAR